jgi:hypothetical protein
VVTGKAGTVPVVAGAVGKVLGEVDEEMADLLYSVLREEDAPAARLYDVATGSWGFLIGRVDGDVLGGLIVLEEEEMLLGCLDDLGDVLLLEPTFRAAARAMAEAYAA